MSEEQPHDWLFKEIFSRPEHAASHLRSVVFEHQSSDDPKMPLRMLRYVVGVWSAYVKLHPATRTLPPVIPCVLYHGPTPWKSPTNVASMVDVDDATRAVLDPLIPS